MKLDIHTHILPSKLPNLQERYGCPGWINIRPSETEPNVANMYKDDVFFRRIEKNCWCSEDRHQDMAETNVTAQVLSTVPVMFNYAAKPEHTSDLARLLNDDIAERCRVSNTSQSDDVKGGAAFYGFGTVPLQHPQLAVEELTRCVKDLGFRGVQIGSHINDWNLDEKQLYPFWKRAEELNCAIFVHPWDMEHVCRTTKYWLPWLVGMPAETTTAICCLMMGNVFTQFPRLKFCFAHGGGALPFTIGRIQHGYKVRPDLCATDCAIEPREFLGRFYTDSLVHDKRSLDLLIDVVGRDRVVLGSDYPFPLGELDVGRLIEQSDYSDDLKHKLLYKNGMELLGLE